MVSNTFLGIVWTVSCLKLGVACTFPRQCLDPYGVQHSFASRIYTNPPIPAVVFSSKTVQGEAGAEAPQAEGQESEAQPSSEHRGFQIRGVNLVVTIFSMYLFHVGLTVDASSTCWLK